MTRQFCRQKSSQKQGKNGHILSKILQCGPHLSGQISIGRTCLMFTEYSKTNRGECIIYCVCIYYSFYRKMPTSTYSSSVAHWHECSLKVDGNSSKHACLQNAAFFWVNRQFSHPCTYWDFASEITELDFGASRLLIVPWDLLREKILTDFPPECMIWMRKRNY